MKKLLLPVALVCITLSSAFAGDIDILLNIGRNGNDRITRELRSCLTQNDSLNRENRQLKDRLLTCNNGYADREKIRELNRENQYLSSQNRFLNDQVERLKIDIARLELEAHPDRGGQFSLAEAIKACGKISSSSYAQQCAAAAKLKSISANVIDQCAKISESYYALTCVKSAGDKETTARQVEACLGINSTGYASQCIAIAGEKRIGVEIIKSCVSASNESYYQLECIKSM